MTTGLKKFKEELDLARKNQVKKDTANYRTKNFDVSLSNDLRPLLQSEAARLSISVPRLCNQIIQAYFGTLPVRIVQDTSAPISTADILALHNGTDWTMKAEAFTRSYFAGDYDAAKARLLEISKSEPAYKEAVMTFYTRVCGAKSDNKKKLQKLSASS